MLHRKPESEVNFSNYFFETVDFSFTCINITLFIYKHPQACSCS